jgi:hypothetical protein
MSLFQTAHAPCPACGVVADFEMVHSVNADRRPDLRDAIMDRTFQRAICESCGESFRMEPELTFLHVGAKQYLAVWPASKVNAWVEYEKRSDDSFLGLYGPAGTPIAQQIGSELVRRTVFGWEAAHEKLLANESGIDDVTLELAKLAIRRWADDEGPGADSNLRLLAVTAGANLVFGAFEPDREVLIERITVPTDLLAEIEADAEGWAALRSRLSAGSFVDLQRLVLEPP